MQYRLFEIIITQRALDNMTAMYQADFIQLIFTLSLHSFEDLTIVLDFSEHLKCFKVF